MAKLATEHPDVAVQFNAGNFTAQKTRNVFSSIPIDQAYEQNNALIKGSAEQLDLPTTQKPSAVGWLLEQK